MGIEWQLFKIKSSGVLVYNDVNIINNIDLYN